MNVRTDPMPRLDEQVLRDVLGSLATPVVVVTTEIDGTRYGFTASSFTSVSMAPQLLGVYLAETSSSYAAFRRAPRAAINVLAHHQAGVARRFAVRGGDKFAGLDLDEQASDALGTPVIADTMVTLAGEIVERVTVGDHILLLIAPHQATAVRHSPLIYHQRGFHRLPEQGRPTDGGEA